MICEDMTTHQRVAPVVEGEDSAVLERIGEPGTHLAIWHRARPAPLDDLDTLDPDTIADLSFPCALDELDTEVAQGLDEAAYPKGAGSRALAAEIATLARRFAAIMRCHAVKIRLEVIRTDACRKFHADYVTARLICTLSGPGTQWIETTRPDAIQHLGTGAVGLFKGRLLAPEPAVLHRSVPLSATGGTRLVLVLDPLEGAKTQP